MRTPDAEVAIDAELIAALVEAQLPRLAGSVRVVANGWDNVVARLGEQHVVRMPRRAVAVPLVRNEVAWLPLLAANLPVPIPVPIAVGAPALGYPWPWTVNRWLPGVPVTEVPTDARRRIGSDLAAVHRALHVPAPADAPVNPVRGGPLADRAEAVATRLASGEVPQPELLGATFEDALAAPVHDGPALWIHGDPHPGNLLATEGAHPGLAAVLDFGDLGAGDPATDLAIAWTAFDPDARAAYRAALAPSAATWRRARGWAVVIASALATAADDHPAHAATAAHTIEQLTAEASG